MAKALLFNITGGKDLSLFDVTEASNIITEAVDPDANIIFGAVIDEKLDDEIRVTVIATGFNGKNPALTGQSQIQSPGWKTNARKAPEVKTPAKPAAPAAPAKEEPARSNIINNNFRDTSNDIPPWMQGR